MATSQDSASPMATSSPTTHSQPSAAAATPHAPTTPTTATAGAAVTVSLSLHRRSHPYFSKRQQAALASVKNDAVPSQKESAVRAQSCKFMEGVGRKMGLYPFWRMWVAREYRKGKREELRVKVVRGFECRCHILDSVTHLPTYSPQCTISTAQALYHRFYLFYSLKDYPSTDISIACLFVACKVEETIKKLKDIIVVAHSVRHPDGKELDPEQISEDRRRRIMGYERLVLETLCFDFQVQHPYEFVVKFVRLIKGACEVEGSDRGSRRILSWDVSLTQRQPTPSSAGDKLLAYKAWEIVNDSYKTPLCLQLPPHTIAAGGVYLASRLLPGCKIFDQFEGKPWHRLFLSRIEDIEDVCHQILDLYITTGPDGAVPGYTRLKIELNQRAQRRGPDPNQGGDYYDDAEEGGALLSIIILFGFVERIVASVPSDVVLLRLAEDDPSTMEAVNTNQHTVCYQFSALGVLL
ncbi:cyclin-like protein [Jimgerdemannia flammicorona]|uniref:Cyclin-like protein n=1 Tax=Jimgerdemannia flammicorona TaxID=994334 RepID=A0A433D7L4_9FUNG|nr:cyclin-like protein [Jimgerdemannia flammicorona]